MTGCTSLFSSITRAFPPATFTTSVSLPSGVVCPGPSIAELAPLAELGKAIDAIRTTDSAAADKTPAVAFTIQTGIYAMVLLLPQ
jgi:hypothetical protein